MIWTDVDCFRLGEESTETDTDVVAVETPGECSHINPLLSEIPAAFGSHFVCACCFQMRCLLKERI